VAAAMADQQCPLAPNAFAKLRFQTRMNLARVKEIEQHVSSGGPCIHPPLKELILHGFFDGTTPLLLACQEGHLDAVQHIIATWGADVNAAGIYYFSIGGKIERATAIFAAAHEGHSEIVKYLISKVADVQAITSTDNHPSYAGVTPLHAALMWCPYVYDQSYYEECVKCSIIAHILLEAGADPSTPTFDGTPVWMMKYCGVDATIALVNYGLDLSLVNWKAETILHYWSRSDHAIAEEERLDVVRHLIDHGADLSAQDDAGFIPILTSAESYTCKVFDLLFEEDLLDREKQIDALELAGSYLLLARDPYYQEKGCNFWRQASQLREESPHINKLPIEISSGRIVEWATPEDLERVIEDPSTYWIQSIFTRFRIYSGMGNLEAVSHSLSEYFLRLAEFESGDPDEFEDGGGVIPNPEEHPDQDVVTVLWGYLDTILRFSPFDADDHELDHEMIHTASAVRYLTQTLPSLQLGDPLRNIESIKIILGLILSVMQGGTPSLSYEFFTVLAGLPLVLHPNIRELLAKSVLHCPETLIPIACETENWDTLRLLLHLGADPKTPKWFGHVYTSSLHVLATRDETPVRSAAANLLFYYGANPNQMNDEGVTAVDIWMKKNCGEEGMQSVKWNDRPDWCRDTIPKLSQLCVKTVHIHGVPIDEEYASLPPFQELPKSA